MLDLCAIGRGGLPFGAFVLGEGANVVLLSIGRKERSVTMLEAVLKLALVAELAVAPEDLAFAVSTVTSPLTPV